MNLFVKKNVLLFSLSLILKKNFKLAVGSTQMAEKLPGGKNQTGFINVSTNIYGLMMGKASVFRYDITLVGITRSEKPISLTRKLRGE